MSEIPNVLIQSVDLLNAKKAENITILDLREVANIADYFVIATAMNIPHLKALADGLQRLYKNEHYHGVRHVGSGASGWVIADYDGVMIHIFSVEMRDFYDLEKLWNNAKWVTLPSENKNNRLPQPKKSTHKRATSE